MKALFLCNYPLCGVELAWRHRFKLDARSSNLETAVPVQPTDLQDYKAFFRFFYPASHYPVLSRKEIPMRKFVLPIVLFVSLHAFAEDAPQLVEARKVASAVPPKLLQVLTEEISKGGAESAIAVCREKAPQMAKATSEQTGWAIRRVSLRNRNPNAIPDGWERANLEDFDRRAAAGESPATLEKGELVTNGDRKEYRYMKALPVQQICVACHGAPEQLKPGVKLQLQTLYPADKGVGYAMGQIRGAMTIRKAL